MASSHVVVRQQAVLGASGTDMVCVPMYGCNCIGGMHMNHYSMRSCKTAVDRLCPGAAIKSYPEAESVYVIEGLFVLTGCKMPNGRTSALKGLT